MKTAKKLLMCSMCVLVLQELLVRAMAHSHVAHSLLASGPSLGAALLAAALVVVRLGAVVLVPGAIATAVVLAVAHYLVGSKSTGISDGGAEGTGTSIGVAGKE
jgi:hypothetical protein